MLKRLVISFLIVTVMSSAFLPHRTQAFAPAIPYVAIGTFVTAVAGAAAIVEVLGYEQESDELDMFAKYVWDVAKQEIKDSVISSYNAAVQTGSNMMTLSSDVVDYYKGHIATIGNYFASDPVVTATVGNHSYNKISQNYQSSFNYKMSPATGYEYFTTANGKKTVADAIEVLNISPQSSYRPHPIYGGYYTTVTVRAPGLVSSYDIPSIWPFDKNADMKAASAISTIFSVTQTVILPKGTTASIKEKEAQLGVAIPNAIPVPMPKDFIVVGADAPTVPLDVQPDNTWVNKETGKVYNPADVNVKAYPRIGVHTDTATGFKVGTVVQDGTKVIIKTGQKVSTGEVDIPSTGILENIWTSLKNFFDLSKPIEWSPMRAIPQGLTTAFPFSLPWDVKRAIDTLTVTGERPDFTITMRVNGKNIQRELPFADYMDNYVPMIRSSIVFLFTFGLIFATRKLLGGAK